MHQHPSIYNLVFQQNCEVSLKIKQLYFRSTFFNKSVLTVVHGN